MANAPVPVFNSTRGVFEYYDEEAGTWSSVPGLLVPKMTTTQRDAINSPSIGLSIFNLSTNRPEYYDGADWVSASSGEASVTNTAHAHPWADITGKPTTLAGYGISDAYTQDEIDAAIALVGNSVADLAADVTALDAAKAEAVHVHSGADITTGTVAAARLAAHSHSPADITGTAVITTDSRLSDARAPLAHTHPWGQITNPPATYAPSAHSHAPADITGTAVVTGDARLSDNRRPGFVAGDGGTVIQLTSKSTAVTLNRLTGTIQTAAVALAAGAIVTFVFNNSTLAPNDLIVATHHATGTFGAYNIAARATGAGTASISIRNTSAASLNEAIVIKYAVVKAVVA